MEVTCFFRLFYYPFSAGGVEVDELGPSKKGFCWNIHRSLASYTYFYPYHSRALFVSACLHMVRFQFVAWMRYQASGCFGLNGPRISYLITSKVLCCR